jgi:hypothetical protein
VAVAAAAAAAAAAVAAAAEVAAEEEPEGAARAVDEEGERGHKNGEYDVNMMLVEGAVDEPLVGQAGQLQNRYHYARVDGNNEGYCMMCSRIRDYTEFENQYLLICTNDANCAGGVGNNSYHTFCIGRDKDVPEGDWYCYFCALREQREDASFRGF